LRELANLIAVISVANASVVAVLGLLFYRQSRSLDRAEAAVLERENLASLGRMVATIAHEIRNPLSIIRASAERVRRRHGVADEELSYITQEVDELDRVLTGYLDFAHARPPELVPVALTKALRRAVAAAASEREARRVSIAERFPEADVMVTGDPQRIRQAILNVLLNAIQAAPPDGRVEVALESDGGRACVVVTDDGPGIDPSHASDVTRPFFTTRADGSGLGLAVVRAVMEEHGGELVITSGGRGTRVTLVFPRAQGSYTPSTET
jgi:signal transduction histidine kinase